MAQGKIFPLRLPDEQRERYDAAAKYLGVSTAKFIRDAADAAEQAVAGGAKPARAAKATKTGGSRRRTEICIHRRRPEEYCSRCDR